VIRELEEYFHFLHGGSKLIKGVTISEESLDVLMLAIKTCPNLCAEIIVRLSSWKNSHAKETLKLHLILIDGIAALLREKKFEEVLYLLHFLNFSNELIPHLKSLFEFLIENSSEENSEYSDKFKREHIYSSLVSSENVSLLEFFFSVEDQKEIQLHERHQLPAGLFDSEAGFWSKFYKFVRANRVHFVELVIQKSLEWLETKDYHQLNRWMSFFPKLKPLVLLLAWERLKSNVQITPDLLLLFSSFQDTSDHPLNPIGKTIYFHLHTTRWFLDFLQTLPNPPPLQLADRSLLNPRSTPNLPHLLFHYLQTHSLLSTFQPYLHLIPPTALDTIFANFPESSPLVITIEFDFDQVLNKLFSFAGKSGENSRTRSVYSVLHSASPFSVAANFRWEFVCGFGRNVSEYSSILCRVAGKLSEDCDVGDPLFVPLHKILRQETARSKKPAKIPV
jgi:hypothetical protein